MTKNPSPPDLTDGELEEMFGAALLKLPGDSLNRAAVAAMRAAIASDRARWSHQPAPPAGEFLKEAAWLRNECSAENADGNWISMSIDQALDLASLLERQAAPAPAGEVGELAALIRQIALAWEPDARLLGNMTAGQFTRAADLLDELVQVAYAASDFICGTHFPEFANEHGGIDRLTADLRRLVAQFEYGPRPVPGVDVPGPDGDWGGLEELCNAEGVDLQIGVPLLQRAQEAWKNSSQAAPVPVSERKPGPDDCLDEGWAWFFSPRVGWRQAVLPVSPAYTHWLPATALPLPAGEVG